MNKTIYVRDEDAKIWSKAGSLAGELSPVITSLLKSYVAEKEGSARGFERIVLRYVEAGVLYAKAFMGRWLIPPDDPWTWDQGACEEGEFRNYSVAVTAKNRVVVFGFHGTANDGEYDDAQFRDFDTFEKVGQAYPQRLIPDAMRRLGIQVQELDI